MSHFHGIVGVVAEDTPLESEMMNINGINSGITDLFRRGDFKKIEPTDVSVSREGLQDFVYWLTRNDSFIHLIGTKYTHLVLENDGFRLIASQHTTPFRIEW